MVVYAGILWWNEMKLNVSFMGVTMPRECMSRGQMCVGGNGLRTHVFQPHVMLSCHRTYIAIATEWEILSFILKKLVEDPLVSVCGSNQGTKALGGFGLGL